MTIKIVNFRVMEVLEERFRSGNGIPVERAHITAAEFQQLKDMLAMHASKAREYADTMEMWRQRYGAFQEMEMYLQSGQTKAS